LDSYVDPSGCPGFIKHIRGTLSPNVSKKTSLNLLGNPRGFFCNIPPSLVASFGRTVFCKNRKADLGNSFERYTNPLFLLAFLYKNKEVYLFSRCPFDPGLGLSRSVVSDEAI